MKNADDYAGAAGRLPSDEPTEGSFSAGSASDGASAPSSGRHLSIEEALGLQNYKGVPVREVDELSLDIYEMLFAISQVEMRQPAEQRYNRLLNEQLRRINARHVAGVTNCSPGRSAYLTGRNGAVANILVGAAMGAVMGASIAIFAVGVYTVLRAIFG